MNFRGSEKADKNWRLPTTFAGKFFNPVEVGTVNGKESVGPGGDECFQNSMTFIRKADIKYVDVQFEIRCRGIEGATQRNERAGEEGFTCTEEKVERRHETCRRPNYTIPAKNPCHNDPC